MTTRIPTAAFAAPGIDPMLSQQAIDLGNSILSLCYGSSELPLWMIQNALAQATKILDFDLMVLTGNIVVTTNAATALPVAGSVQPSVPVTSPAPPAPSVN